MGTVLAGGFAFIAGYLLMQLARFAFGKLATAVLILLAIIALIVMK